MKVIFTFILFFAANILFAQLKESSLVELNWQENYRGSKKTAYIEFAGRIGDNIFTLKSKKNKLAIFKNDMSFKNESYCYLDKKINNLKIDLETVFPFKNELLLINKIINYDNNSINLYQQKINPVSLNKTEHNILLSINYLKKKDIGTFHYRISIDSSKLLVYYAYPTLKYEPEKFALFVFDQNLNIVWNKELNKIEERLYTIDDIDIDNDANVFIVAREHNKKDGLFKQDKSLKNADLIIAYTHNGKKLNEYKLSLKNEYITDIKFKIKNEFLFIGGFYSYNGLESVKGSLSSKIDFEAEQILWTQTNDFKEDLITKDWSDEKIERAKKRLIKKEEHLEIEDLVLKEIFVTSSDEIILFAEEYYVVEKVSTIYDANAGPQNRTSYTYHYDDIYVIKHNENGIIEMAESLNKEQTSSDDKGYYLSYSVYQRNDDFFLIYNESVKDFAQEDISLWQKLEGKTKRSQMTVITSVNFEDKIFNKELLFIQKEKLRCRPKACRQIDNKSFLIYNRTGRFEELGVIE